MTLTWSAPTTGAVPTGYTVLARMTPTGPIAASLTLGNVLTTTAAASDGTY